MERYERNTYFSLCNDPIAAQIYVNAINLIYSYFTCMEGG